MTRVMTNLVLNMDKVQLKMAERCMNPYDLCSAAGISYATYRRILKNGSCKIGTLGKIAAGLHCGVLDIVDQMEKPQSVVEE